MRRAWSDAEDEYIKTNSRYSKSSISTLLYRPATKTERNYGYIFRKVLDQ